MFLRGLVGLVWGQDEQVLRVPFFGTMLTVEGLSLSLGNLIVIFTTLVLIAAFAVLYRFTRYGTAMCATASDQDTAMVMGVSAGQVFAVSWGVASFVAVIGGAVVLGGLDSVVGGRAQGVKLPAHVNW